MMHGNTYNKPTIFLLNKMFLMQTLEGGLPAYFFLHLLVQIQVVVLALVGVEFMCPCGYEGAFVPCCDGLFQQVFIVSNQTGFFTLARV